MFCPIEFILTPYQQEYSVVLKCQSKVQKVTGIKHPEILPSPSVLGYMPTASMKISVPLVHATRTVTMKPR